MKIEIKNIGKVKEASVDIRGITIIAGPNDTGKSTVSKTLFSVFNSFYHLQDKIEMEKHESLYRVLTVAMFDNDRNVSLKKISEFVNNLMREKKNNSEQGLDDILDMCITPLSENDKSLFRKSYENYREKIQDVLNIPDEEFFHVAMNRYLSRSFNSQINNIFTSKPGTIILSIKERPMEIEVKDDKVVSVSNKLSLNTEAIYLDNPFILDVFGDTYLRNASYNDLHELHLLRKLRLDEPDSEYIREILSSKKLDKVYANLNEVFSGQISRSKEIGWAQILPNAKKPLNVRNLSAGLKTFAIIKTLLLNGSIEENGLLILDEPEIHLHPKWQSVFAKLIVELQRAFGLHILLNSHSPYFLHAIEVFSEKAGIADKCKYYFAYNEKRDSFIKDVTQNREIIYETLAAPLQDLENERYAD